MSMGNRGSLSLHADAAYRGGYPPCPSCQADVGEVCRTPGQRLRAPHKARQVLINAAVEAAFELCVPRVSDGDA